MSFIRGDNSAPLLLFPCTKSPLCSFCLFLQYQAAARCINKGSSGLNKLLIWTMAVCKSTGPLTGNIFLSWSDLSDEAAVCLHCNFLRAAGLVPHFCFTFRTIREFRGQVDFLCFHCPPPLSVPVSSLLQQLPI